jgi:hypothetical protein
MKVGGNWPITNFDLASKYTIFFQKIVKPLAIMARHKPM